MRKKHISVLFVEKKSIYKEMGLDCWDQERDALNYKGRTANIYHPPCRLWSILSQFSTADESEKYLALWSVNKVRSYSGILEHPAYSKLWDLMNLPKPGDLPNLFGGFTIEVDQFNFGHLARKRTWLYIVGIPNDHSVLIHKKIPAKVKYGLGKNLCGKIDLPKHKRSSTPKKFAKFLVKIVDEINNYKMASFEIDPYGTDPSFDGGLQKPM